MALQVENDELKKDLRLKGDKVKQAQIILDQLKAVHAKIVDNAGNYARNNLSKLIEESKKKLNDGK